MDIHQLLVASFGHCDVVKCLLSFGAEINLCGHDGQRPLFIASMGGYSDVVECLPEAGAEINLIDILGQSPLFAASMSGHYEVLNVYLVLVQISICVIEMNFHHCF